MVTDNMRRVLAFADATGNDGSCAGAVQVLINFSEERHLVH